MEATTSKAAGFDRLAQEARRIRASGNVTRTDGIDELIAFSEFWTEEIPRLRARWLAWRKETKEEA
jgi:hypothetical protein